MHFVTAIFLI